MDPALDAAVPSSMKFPWFLAACLGLLLLSPAEACSVPVFAYALRRWEPEPHVLATARDEAWRGTFAKQCEDAGVNLGVEAGEGQDRIGCRSMAQPWWTGRLDDQRLGSLITSPLRRELARRLASGETAVWLFIPGGDAAADAAARTLLAERLAYLQQVTELPPVETDDDTAATTLSVAGPAVRVAFSLIEVRRDDPAEWVLASEVLARARNHPGPCAVPVYGRARALIILRGATFTTAAIDDTAAFLTAACSCQVKERNPGWDLLVACDWEAALADAAEAPSAVPPAPVAPETVVISPHPAVEPPAMTRIRWWPAAGVILGLAAALGWWWRRIRARSAG